MPGTLKVCLILSLFFIFNCSLLDFLNTSWMAALHLSLQINKTRILLSSSWQPFSDVGGKVLCVAEG